MMYIMLRNIDEMKVCRDQSLIIATLEKETHKTTKSLILVKNSKDRSQELLRTNWEKSEARIVSFSNVRIEILAHYGSKNNLYLDLDQYMNCNELIVRSLLYSYDKTPWAKISSACYLNKLLTNN